MPTDFEWSDVPAFEPGTVKRFGYYTQEDTYWPSVEEQVKAAQKHNLERHFSGSHEHVPLYLFVDDCEHENPDEMTKYFEVEDLLEEWMAEHHPEYSGDNPHRKKVHPQDGRSEYWKWYDRKWELQREGMKAVPLYAEYQDAMSEYEDQHNYVCLLSPISSCCKYCNQNELDYGEGVSENHCDYGQKDIWEVEEFWCLFEAKPDRV